MREIIDTGHLLPNSNHLPPWDNSWNKMRISTKSASLLTVCRSSIKQEVSPSKGKALRDLVFISRLSRCQLLERELDLNLESQVILEPLLGGDLVLVPRMNLRLSRRKMPRNKQISRTQAWTIQPGGRCKMKMSSKTSSKDWVKKKKYKIPNMFQIKWEPRFIKIWPDMLKTVWMQEWEKSEKMVHNRLCNSMSPLSRTNPICNRLT